MAITLVGTPQTGTARNGLDVTLTFDGSPAEDDVVVLFGGHHANDQIGPITAGYTSPVSNFGSDPRFGVWLKALGPTPDADVVCEGGGNGQSGVAYGCYVLRGADISNILDAALATTGPSTATTRDNPAITTVTDGAWVLALLGVTGSATAAGTIPGYSNQVEASAVDTVRAVAAGTTIEIAAAGIEDPPAWSGIGTTQDWYAVTVAIRPAVASPPTSGIAGELAGAQAVLAGSVVHETVGIPGAIS